ncbi:2Fe-2S iron-sulfur cluster-binding protein [Cupriavidus basilensis]
MRGAQAQALKAAWIDLDVVQCGYCPERTAHGCQRTAEKIPKPSDADIDAFMSGIVCRCGTYPRIRAAIHRAAGQPARLEAAARRGVFPDNVNARRNQE